MNILIAYASTEGQTRKIANLIADHIRSRDHKAKVFDTSSTLHDVDVNEFDKVVLAGSVHQQKHQDSLEIYVAAKRKKLEARPTLFVSVSLGSGTDCFASDAEGLLYPCGPLALGPSRYGNVKMAA